ncbi:hypothetical protein Hanom_Chr11g00998531 [Helianthus anomalus]
MVLKNLELQGGGYSCGDLGYIYGFYFDNYGGIWNNELVLMMDLISEARARLLNKLIFRLGLFRAFSRVARLVCTPSSIHSS